MDNKKLQFTRNNDIYSVHLPLIEGRQVKTLVISLRSKNPDLFNSKTSYTLLKLKYREVPTDLHHREIEIYSDLIKPADYSANRDGRQTRIIIAASLVAVLLLGLCVYSIIRFSKMKRREG